MIFRKIRRAVAASVCALCLGACADLPTLLAGSAKGFCRHNPGTSPCTRPAPGHIPNVPPP